MNYGNLFIAILMKEVHYSVDMRRPHCWGLARKVRFAKNLRKLFVEEPGEGDYP